MIESINRLLKLVYVEQKAKREAEEKAKREAERAMAEARKKPSPISPLMK